MGWEIQNHLHLDNEIAVYIENIFTQTCNYIFKKLGPPPLGLKPISLIYDYSNGPIVYWPLKPDKYEIGISVNGIDPYKIVYQMAHELCHIYIDPRINGVFIEIVCHKTAFDVLEDIGSTMTSFGKQGVDDYIQKAKAKVELNKSLNLNSIDLKWTKQAILSLEKSKTLEDRDMNNLIALKLKRIIDPIDKYSLIKHVKFSVDNPPNSNINDLNTNPITNINFTLLLENIEKENKQLFHALKVWN